MKKQWGDILIVVAIIAVVGILLFLKRDMIMEMLHIQPVSTEPKVEEAQPEPSAQAKEKETKTIEIAKTDAVSKDETASANKADDSEAAEEASEEEENKPKISDPLLVADNVPENTAAVNVPTAGSINCNVIGLSWTDLKQDYSYSDFEADPDDLAQLRFVPSETIQFYQSPGSGEIFGIEDDKIVAYLKRWEGAPMDEAITISELFDITPYVYQATDHLNLYEWQIGNCYVGMLVEDTGSEMKETAPLYAETYVEKKAINTFYK